VGGGSHLATSGFSTAVTKTSWQATASNLRHVSAQFFRLEALLLRGELRLFWDCLRMDSVPWPVVLTAPTGRPHWLHSFECIERLRTHIIDEAQREGVELKDR
jgi:hypothetical protein